MRARLQSPEGSNSYLYRSDGNVFIMCVTMNSTIRSKKIRENKVLKEQSFWGSFQVTVDSNHVIAITTLGDWLNNSAPVFQPISEKQNQNRSLIARAIFPTLLNMLQVISKNSDCFIVSLALL